jgi:hypothetical protein
LFNQNAKKSYDLKGFQMAVWSFRRPVYSKNTGCTGNGFK